MFKNYTHRHYCRVMTNEINKFCENSNECIQWIKVSDARFKSIKVLHIILHEDTNQSLIPKKHKMLFVRLWHFIKFSQLWIYCINNYFRWLKTKPFKPFSKLKSTEKILIFYFSCWWKRLFIQKKCVILMLFPLLYFWIGWIIYIIFKYKKSLLSKYWRKNKWSIKFLWVSLFVMSLVMSYKLLFNFLP